MTDTKTMWNPDTAIIIERHFPAAPARQDETAGILTFVVDQESETEWDVNVWMRTTESTPSKLGELIGWFTCESRQDAERVCERFKRLYSDVCEGAGQVPPDHRWQWCSQCKTFMVVCGTCRNNCCNGTYGDDQKCPDCPSAYDMQEAGWKLRDEEWVSKSGAGQAGSAEREPLYWQIKSGRRLYLFKNKPTAEPAYDAPGIQFGEIFYDESSASPSEPKAAQETCPSCGYHDANSPILGVGYSPDPFHKAGTAPSESPEVPTIGVPAKRYVKLPSDVRGDWPIGHEAIARAGVHEAVMNPLGAVSVLAENGTLLGIKPAEFEWVGVPAAEAREPQLIVSDADTCGGLPRIKGTRITVSSILDAATEAIVAATRINYPQLSEREVLAAIGWLASSRSEMEKPMAREPEAKMSEKLQAALRKLSMALGNPAIEFEAGEMEAGLVEYAARWAASSRSAIEPEKK